MWSSNTLSFHNRHDDDRCLSIGDAFPWTLTNVGTQRWRAAGYKMGLSNQAFALTFILTLSLNSRNLAPSLSSFLLLILSHHPTSLARLQSLDLSPLSQIPTKHSSILQKSIL